MNRDPFLGAPGLPATSATAVPSYGVVRLVSTADGVRTVAAPAADGDPHVYVAGPGGIPAGGRGVVHFLPKGRVAYDPADGPPAVADEWGPASGSFLLRKGRRGFRSAGESDGSTAVFARVTSPTTLYVHHAEAFYDLDPTPRTQFFRSYALYEWGEVGGSRIRLPHAGQWEVRYWASGDMILNTHLLADYESVTGTIMARVEVLDEECNHVTYIDDLVGATLQFYPLATLGALRLNEVLGVVPLGGQQHRTFSARYATERTDLSVRLVAYQVNANHNGEDGGLREYYVPVSGVSGRGVAWLGGPVVLTQNITACPVSPASPPPPPPPPPGPPPPPPPPGPPPPPTAPEVRAIGYNGAGSVSGTFTLDGGGAVTGTNLAFFPNGGTTGPHSVVWTNPPAGLSVTWSVLGGGGVSPSGMGTTASWTADGVTVYTIEFHADE